MAFFFKHLSLSGKIEGLYREEELEIPYKALRECCTNAFCHRLYHRPGSSVGIAIYDDRVEIENSGTFPPDMTLEKLLGGHNSEPQNLIIANVLYKSEVLESWGRGISLMISECHRVGIPDPEFHTDGNSVWVVFHYSRKTIGQDPTAAPQLPHSYPTSRKGVVRNRRRNGFDQRDYGYNRVKRQKQFSGTLPVSGNKAESGGASLSGKAETSPTEIPPYRQREGTVEPIAAIWRKRRNIRKFHPWTYR